MIKKRLLVILLLLTIIKPAHAQNSKTEEQFKKYLITDDDETAKEIIKANDKLYSIYCQAMLTEDSSEQIILLTKFINLKPKHGLPNAYFMRGTAYAISLKYDSAIVDYNKSMELDPNTDYAKKLHFRCNAYINVKEYEKALADANKEIEITKTDAQSYITRGGIYFQMKKYDSAIADWKTAKKLDRSETEFVDDMIDEAKEKMSEK